MILYTGCSAPLLPTAHRKVDRIELNIKVPYRLVILTIIIEILIFEIGLMRARLNIFIEILTAQFCLVLCKN